MKMLRKVHEEEGKELSKLISIEDALNEVATDIEQYFDEIYNMIDHYSKSELAIEIEFKLKQSSVR